MAGDPQTTGVATVTVPAIVHSGETKTVYARCPHLDGKCPACDGSVLDGKPPASKLSAALRAAAPPDLCAQLDELIRQAEHADRKELVAGAGQALFARLKALLPREVRDPVWKPETGWDHVKVFFGWRPQPAATDPLSVLRRAMKGHWINQTCLDAASDLALERRDRPLSAEEMRRFAAFLPVLAEQLHSDKRLPRSA